jgi:thiol:disulfide interchange protein DsbC
MKKVLALSLLLIQSAFAGNIEIPNKKLISRAGKIEQVRDLGSLYEIVLSTPREKRILYETKDGKYIIVGFIFDSKTGKNLTAERNREINRIDISKIPLNEAVHIRFGRGGKKLIAVIDPECPFCRRSFSYFKDKNADLYVFFMPLSFHKNALKWSKEVLCSDNPAQALLNLELNNTVPICKDKEREKKAENTLKKHILITQMLGARATPTFITERGYSIEGLDVRELNSYLKEKQK